MAPPEVDGSGIRWRSSRPAIDGRWSRDLGAGGDPPVPTRRLLETEEGAVDWTCLLPSAQAELLLPDGRRARGLGYAERLELTLRPWKLPIEVLRWGRFLCPETSLVWIDWRGPVPLSLALLDGRPARIASVGDSSVILAEPAAHLDLAPGTILREGLLGGNVLGRVPALRRSLPGRMLRVHETRLHSSAVLDLGTGRRVAGDAVHEVVRWP